jgi:signal transduction histidine kinase
MVCAEPVGQSKPAAAAAWVMVRLTGPEQLESQIGQYRLSLIIALGGIILALGLMLNLGRSMNRQRIDQEKLRDELRRSEHLANLGRLLAGIAHEVRNPLAAIRSTIQLWERLPEAARNPEGLKAILGAVDRLNEIVSRLLYFARSDRGERRSFAINHLLTETCRLLEAQSKDQSVTLQLDLDDSLPAVLGSPDALRRVFLNLATNALQAMPNGGRLRCATNLAPDGHTVSIRFADSGPGIAPETRKHLFEPFFTTREDGTGLGLALCREVVTQHGGRIDLEPSPGTVFCVELPVGGE